MTENTVLQYINDAPEKYREILLELRKNLSEVLPEATESIYYRIPTIKLNGKPIVSYAAFRDHCSLITMRAEIPEKLMPMLKDHKVSGTTIHFDEFHPISKDLLQKIIDLRLQGIIAK